MESFLAASSCDKREKFDYGCSTYPGNETQSPDFGCFSKILGIFRAARFFTSLLPRTVIFNVKLSSMYLLSHIIRDIFMIPSSE